MKKRILNSKRKIIFVIESPLFDCSKILNKIGYEERFHVIDFENILKTELAKETKLSKL